MSTSKEYMQFVLDQLEEFPDVTYRKMFGEYMVYLQGRPVLLVCDNCAMVKKLPELAELMRGAPDIFRRMHLLNCAVLLKINEELA